MTRRFYNYLTGTWVHPPIGADLAAAAGPNGVHARPLSMTERLERYMRQAPGRKLTPRQERRAMKKYRKSGLD